MNKNEIRGYIFMGFAILFVCTMALGGNIIIWMGYSSFNLLPPLTFVLICASAICLATGYAQGKELTVSQIEQKPVLNRIGRSWTQFNLFSMKPADVKVQKTEDGTHLLCDVQILAENWMPQLKSDGNVLTFQISVIGDSGKEKIELESSEAASFIVNAGERTEFVYHVAVPEYIDRVILHFTAESDSMEELYQQDYEFYPGHYTR